jgi:hypothetical protein
MTWNDESRDSSAGPVSCAGAVGGAGTNRASNGTRGWLPGHADAPMSPEGAKRPNRQTEVIYI